MWQQFLSAAEQTVADKRRLSTLALNSRSESLASVSRWVGCWWWWGGWSEGAGLLRWVPAWWWAARIFYRCLTKPAWPEQRSGTRFFRMQLQLVKCWGQTFIFFSGLIGAGQVDRVVRVIDQKFLFPLHRPPSSPPRNGQSTFLSFFFWSRFFIMHCI